MIETQTYIERHPFVSYAVDVVTTSPDTPFGDAYSERLRIIMLYNTRGTSRMRISHGVSFKKDVIVRDIIERAVAENARQVVRDIRAVLSELIAAGTFAVQHAVDADLP